MNRLHMLLAMGLVCSACDDDGGGGAQVSSGLPGDEALRDLSDDDRAVLCRELIRSARTIISPQRLCTAAAAERGANEGECQRFVSACLSLINTNPDPENGVEVCAEDLKRQLAGCDGTVGELEACQTDANRATAAALGAISCADAPLSPQSAANQPPSCKGLAEKCPRIFEFDDGA